MITTTHMEAGAQRILRFCDESVPFEEKQDMPLPSRLELATWLLAVIGEVNALREKHGINCTGVRGDGEKVY